MRRVPEFESDAEAEAFLENDLSDLDVSHFKPVDFAAARKAAQVDLRVPESLLAAVKLRAKARGMSHGRSIRELIERDVARNAPEPALADAASVRDEAVGYPAEGQGRAW
ncbi:CopG family antitoxin [Methylobacterium sp. Leaf466]|uniref:CopG family antitoxin n=1 Tax=Methylobacterium sp. Leaf466 TaxID=1736386 RepID=UPI0009EB805E|nr:CopG family antitoxin [Methylobacterium sp. Leaf466]